MSTESWLAAEAELTEARAENKRLRDAVEVQHVSVQLKVPGSLDFICNDWQRGGWALVRVVPFTEYQAVAVFERRAR